MIRRAIVTAALTIACLAILAWPLSRVGVSFKHDGPGLTRTVSLSDGAVWYTSDTLPSPKPLERERYRLSFGGQPIIQSLIVRTGAVTGPMVTGAVAAPTTAVLRLVWILAGAVGLLLLLTLLAFLRRRSRRERGRCLACGYQRAIGVAPCSECGATPREADERTRAHPGRLVRDSGLVLFAALLALSCRTWAFAASDRRAERAHRASAFDYSWYLGTCQPHLDGSVVVAQPGAGPDSLLNTAQRAGAGATIVLLPGKHDLGDAGRGRMPALGGLKDVWLVGSGAAQTELSMGLTSCQRVRIEGVTIVCHDEPAIDLRDGGSLYLRGCRISGYNSGAGGEEAIFGAQTALLIEGCEFEGKTGRGSNSRRGCAFDLRGENRVYLRDDRFIDNNEVFRDASGVMDRCTASTDQPQFFHTPGGPDLWLRSTSFPSSRLSPGVAGTGFKEAIDDLDPLQRLAAGKGPGAWTDPNARAVAETLDLGEGLWARLLMHPSKEVRELAASRLKLSTPAPPAALERALGQLDQTVLPADVSLSILGAGEGARAGLEQAAASGPEQARANAKALLRLLEVQPPLPDLWRHEQLRPPP
jgi:hypothetical protein